MTESSTVLKEKSLDKSKKIFADKDVNLLSLSVIRRDGSITPFKSDKISLKDSTWSFVSLYLKDETKDIKSPMSILPRFF